MQHALTTRNEGRVAQTKGIHQAVIGRRIIHLRRHGAPPNTPLACVYVSPTLISYVTPSLITDALRQAVTFLGPELGFNPKDVSARCLRAAGANALGRWRSYEML